MDIRGTIHSFLDKIFNPPISVLKLGLERLDEVKLVVKQGINVGKYLSVFGDMPFAWQLVISSILLSVVLLGSLIIFRSLIRLFYAAKDGITP